MADPTPTTPAVPQDARPVYVQHAELADAAHAARMDSINRHTATAPEPHPSTRQPRYRFVQFDLRVAVQVPWDEADPYAALDAFRSAALAMPRFIIPPSMPGDDTAGVFSIDQARRGMSPQVRDYASDLR